MSPYTQFLDYITARQVDIDGLVSYKDGYWHSTQEMRWMDPEKKESTEVDVTPEGDEADYPDYGDRVTWEGHRPGHIDLIYSGGYGDWEGDGFVVPDEGE